MGTDGKPLPPHLQAQKDRAFTNWLMALGIDQDSIPPDRVEYFSHTFESVQKTEQAFDAPLPKRDDR